MHIYIYISPSPVFISSLVSSETPETPGIYRLLSTRPPRENNCYSNFRYSLRVSISSNWPNFIFLPHLPSFFSIDSISLKTLKAEVQFGKPINTKKKSINNLSFTHPRTCIIFEIKKFHVTPSSLFTHSIILINSKFISITK